MARTFRVLGIGLGLMVGLVVLWIGVVYLISGRHLQQEYTLHAVNLTVADDSATLARGRHVATIRGCMDCHGVDFGGQIFIDDPMLGRFAGPNLTRGGRGAVLTVADWERAVRHGVRSDGRPLRFMPAIEYNQLSDEDLTALIAYVRHLSPVDRSDVPIRIGPLGRMLHLTGNLPLLLTARLIDHDAPHRPAPPYGPTAEYGAYLATSCAGCHGPGFSGGPIPGVPPEWPLASNLTPDPETGLGTWSESDFMRALRDGTRPDGSALDARYMPVRFTSQMTDVEIRALWAFLQTLPSTPEGNH
ncbi:c-type cytochrome [Rhodothermus marinus]|uniref:c-type cytochrome n=1 Tax=Rhodothermus marinus TaxID=29549 RepID=UPI0012BA4F79|nr:cytochrome c [Rhodothermus marinus]BBM73734.1 hypothetical protein RmaAA338_25990 [Rhodothermus marinus]